MKAVNLSVDTIQGLLQAGLTGELVSFSSDHHSVRDAAVLIPMVTVQSEWHLLFTRRSDELTDHRGQVAFPGGAAEAGDRSPIDTALRETHEEIGVRPSDVEVLGRLNGYVTISSFRVTPVVGTFKWPYPLKIQTAEVSRVFTMPLGWLAEPGNWKEQMYRSQNGVSHPVIFYEPYDGELLWGISARITVDFIRALGFSSPGGV